MEPFPKLKTWGNSIPWKIHLWEDVENELHGLEANPPSLYPIPVSNPYIAKHFWSLFNININHGRQRRFFLEDKEFIALDSKNIKTISYSLKIPCYRFLKKTSLYSLPVTLDIFFQPLPTSQPKKQEFNPFSDWKLTAF